MRRTLESAARIAEHIAGVFLVMLFACVFIQIIMRNVFSTGSIILEELARLSLVSLVFLMVPVLSISKQHIIVDVVLSRVGPGMRRAMDLFISLVVLVFMLLLLFSIIQVMGMNWNVRTPAMRMPNIVYYVPIIAGLLLAFLSSVHACLEMLFKRGGNA